MKYKSASYNQTSARNVSGQIKINKAIHDLRERFNKISICSIDYMPRLKDKLLFLRIKFQHDFSVML